MRVNDIVKDQYGNVFRVVEANEWGTSLESVATKELFTVPPNEPLTVLPGLRAR